MNNSYTKTVILYCLQKIDGERTIYSVLHLLNGKKSSQTIQDAHLFHFDQLFNTIPLLSRATLDKIVGEMERDQWISQRQEQHFQVTKKGLTILEKALESQPIPTSLNGWKFHQQSEVFWMRLALLIQAVSHLNHHHLKYLPIQRKKEVRSWVKSFLLQLEFNRAELGKRLLEELLLCLGSQQLMNPSIIVLRLSGYGTIGLTSIQAAEKMEMPLDYFQHQFLGMIHFMLETVKAESESYPLLSRLILETENLVPLTISSEKTYHLLKKGLKVNEIASRRMLKTSTIEDHIVEVALNVSSFDISPFVNREKQETILEVARTNPSKRLKHIHQLVPDADYFEIRLVLAKFGEKT